MLLRYIDQMKNQGNTDCAYFPKFICVTVWGNDINIYFESERQLMDWMSHRSAAAAVAGYAMLIQVFENMVHYWIKSGLITGSPDASLLFKRPGDSDDFDNVCFLQGNMVSLHGALTN
jgi:hypothetical protein